MTGVTKHAVAGDEADIRLDRWFKRHYPDLGFGAVQKLLRTGQVRVDGKRAKAGTRLTAGQEVRVPPLEGQRKQAAKPTKPARPKVSDADAEWLRAFVLYRDDKIIAINKPAGLAVQGGSKTTRHLDGMLDALRFGKERPRLVHRLDRDTSGVLVLGRTASAAAELAAAFRAKQTVKTYWALVKGVPEPKEGRIDQSLAKRQVTRGGERVVATDDEEGRRAITEFVTVDHAGKRVAWLALRPVTGRTHQLRAHCALIGTPIVGDHKYGGGDADLRAAGLPNKLHLHARSLSLSLKSGARLELIAPLPAHMSESFDLLGFDQADGVDPFGEDEEGRR